MSNAPIDTPDWQRASVNAGKLLATVPLGTSTVMVNVPPNTRSLGIFLPTPNATSVTVTGNTSGLQYTAVPRLYMTSEGSNLLYYVGILSQLDASVNVTISPNPGSQWWVCGLTDTPVVDVSQLATVLAFVDGINDPQNALSVAGFDGANYHRFATDFSGRIIPMVPTVGVDKAVVAGANVLLAAPVGVANYIFAVDVIDTSGGANTLSFTDGSGNTLGKVALASADPSFTIELQGFRVTTALSVTASASADIVVRYATGP